MDNMEPEQTPQPTQVDPSVVERYQSELAERERQLSLAREEIELRRLREMRLYEQEQARASTPEEEEIPIDPEAKKVLDKIMKKTLAPLQQQIGNLQWQLEHEKAQSAARSTIETIRQHAPFFDEIAPQFRAEFESLPKDEQQMLARSPMSIVKMAHLIYNTQNRGKVAQKAATQMAQTEGVGASTIPAGNGGEYWWRAKGYQNLSRDERARADADIARLRGDR